MNKIPVALIVTRSFDENSSFGRERTLQQIRLALEAEYDLTLFRLHSVLETRRPRDLLGAGTEWLRSVGRGKPLPLQTVLYAGSQEINALVEQLRAGRFQAICVDSVRSQVLLNKLLTALPKTRLVVDFDDLISRRMGQFALQKLIPSLGFLEPLVPGALRWSIQGPLSQLVLRYEASALRRSEQEVADVADAIVLVSAAERDLFRDQIAPAQRERIHALPPPAARPPSAPNTSGPYRFVFIGSDRLQQNRLSIDCLLELWRTLTPPSELHIYGRHDRPNQPVANVHWHGFVKEVAEAYTPGSILLLPVILPGGIKTKAIEAWSFGCPVLGNQLAFEGLNVPDYPLMRAQGEWSSFLLDPAGHAADWAAGARAGHAFVSGAGSRDQYRLRWRDLMGPTSPSVTASAVAE